MTMLREHGKIAGRRPAGTADGQAAALSAVFATMLGVAIAVIAACSTAPPGAPGTSAGDGSTGPSSASAEPRHEEIIVSATRRARENELSRQAVTPMELGAGQNAAPMATAAPPAIADFARRSLSKDAVPALADRLPGGLTAGGARLLSRVQPGEEIWVIQTAAAETRTDDASPGSGTMLARVGAADDQDAEPAEIPLPLKHTEVRAAVTGYVGTVDVTQQFENPYDEKIEAVYMFPLPEKAAVSEFVMTIGERRIRGILRAKEEAQQIYAEARAQGYRASLLTQHRPNIFEQRVANIEPGKRIDVDIRYFHTLAYEDGWYSFVFPTVVGPRYNPVGFQDPVTAVGREDVAEPARGTAVRYLRPSERSAHDIAITVDVDAGVAIEEIAASHGITTVRDGSSRARVALASASTIPNRDFVLQFRVAGDTIKSNLLTYTDPQTRQGYFTLMIYPPAASAAIERRRVEMVFVIDTSGSMSGRPLEQAVAAVSTALERLDEGDTFQIMNFSSSVGRFAPAPVRATRENRQAAKQYLTILGGNGGTEMLSGIRAALGFAHDPQRQRFVTFLTDGYIGNEVEILREVHRTIGATRIFSFGVGGSVNRYLLDGLATEGRGAAAYLGLGDSADEVMAFYFDRISRPALTDVEIDWHGLASSDVYPARLPDLFVGRPVVVTGKFSGRAEGITVRARSAREDVVLRIDAAEQAREQPALRNLWARLRIEDLARRQTWSEEPAGDLASAIRGTALEHGLMSAYTSFVAVDASERTAGDRGTTVNQAVPVPNGVRYDTTVAER
jgi:Ca-activated chloride channel homolog